MVELDSGRVRGLWKSGDFYILFFFVTLDRVERLRLIELGLEVAFGFCILMIALLAWNPFVLRCGSAFCKYRHEFPGRENGGSR